MRLCVTVSIAFVRYYKCEGMDEMEFQEAEQNCRDLITEYHDKEAEYSDDLMDYYLNDGQSEEEDDDDESDEIESTED